MMNDFCPHPGDGERWLVVVISLVLSLVQWEWVQDQDISPTPKIQSLCKGGGNFHCGPHAHKSFERCLEGCLLSNECRKLETVQLYLL